MPTAEPTIDQRDQRLRAALENLIAEAEEARAELEAHDLSGPAGSLYIEITSAQATLNNTECFYGTWEDGSTERIPSDQIVHVWEQRGETWVLYHDGNGEWYTVIHAATGYRANGGPIQFAHKRDCKALRESASEWIDGVTDERWQEIMRDARARSPLTDTPSQS